MPFAFQLLALARERFQQDGRSNPSRIFCALGNLGEVEFAALGSWD
jgi:hypothetical protein